jgi:hypothetical protein
MRRMRLFTLVVLAANALAQSPSATPPNSVGVPKPVADPTAGTWKYKGTDVKAGSTYLFNYSTTVRDDGGMWTVTTAWDFPNLGPVTDVSTLEKGTLILRKESFKHFAKPGRPWLVTINLDFTGSKVTGTSNRFTGQDRPVAVDLAGPVFADAAGSHVTIGCLPLADGYSTTFRDWDVEKLKERVLHLKVVGMERVTVPAGTFDSYKVELASAAGGSDRETVWIAKDSRMPVKGSEVDELYGVTTTELVP